MKVLHYEEVPPDIVREPGARQATIRRLIDAPDGADRFVLSLFELGPNGSTPPHYHDWEHEVYVLAGSLDLVLPHEQRSVTLRGGNVVFLPRGEPHGFSTGPTEGATFLVVAPIERPPVKNFFLSEEPYAYAQSQKNEVAR
jgi:quercetin dioxygenase-like cupin family protein